MPTKRDNVTGQEQKPPAEVETKPEADARDDADGPTTSTAGLGPSVQPNTSDQSSDDPTTHARIENDTRSAGFDPATRKPQGDLERARDTVRERRAREFRADPRKPGAAGAPVEGDDDAYDQMITEGDVTLDVDVSMPSTANPATPGPWDTVDPLEHASSVQADKGTAARAGLGTVNAVVPIPDPSGVERAQVLREAARGEDRMETYPVRRDNGTYATVEHNIDTGETRIVA